MILSIKLKNFYSIGDEIVLDMQAANIRGEKAKKLDNNYYSFSKENVLKTAVIYGANASGKSSVIKAIRQCCGYIYNSHNFNENSTFAFEPFKFHTEDTPSEFCINFMINEVEYEYSFSLTKQEIITESLFYYPKGRKAKVFERDECLSDQKNEKYSFSNVIKRPMDVAYNTSNKNLYISRASQMDRGIAKEIFHYFNSTFILGYLGYNTASVETLFNANKNFILDALKIADSDIIDLKYQKEKQRFEQITFTTKLSETEASPLKKNTIDRDVFRLTSFHRSNPNLPFDFDTEESAGTKKLFYILLSIIDVIQNNKILLIDEIEESLHTKIVEFIIHLFHDSKQSQLIFSTHNTNLLDLDLFRKDQINFVKKDQYGNTELYSLLDFKDFRDNMNPEKGYLQGRFDALPIVDSPNKFLAKLESNG